MRRVALFIILLLCSGCAMTNPFRQFYEDRTGGIDISTEPNLILPVGEPTIYSGSDLEADYQKMIEDGYGLLGYSSFNSGEVSKYQLIAQAKQVKAAVVVFYTKYTNTISGSIPLTLPDTQTLRTTSSGLGSSSGNIYGYGGQASYSGSGSYLGSSTTTIYGTKTTYIPYSQNRYDYLATYWIKQKMPILGVNMNDLTPELREKIGSNKGVVVMAVMKNSPAFMADILRGDILRRINDSEIIDSESFRGLLQQSAGQNVKIEIIRGENKIIKEVKLNMPE